MAGVFAGAGICVEASGTELVLTLVVAGIGEATGREVVVDVGGSGAGRGAAKIASSAAIINTPPKLSSNRRRELFIGSSSLL
jgi:hypothetical protein